MSTEINPLDPPEPSQGDINDLAPIALRVKDAARLIGISVRHVRALIEAGKLPHVHLGSAVVIPVDALRDHLNRQAEKSVRPRKPRSSGA